MSEWDEGMRPILLCPKCGGCHINILTADLSSCFYCKHEGNDFIEAVALTREELGRYAERVIDQAFEKFFDDIDNPPNITEAIRRKAARERALGTIKGGPNE